MEVVTLKPWDLKELNYKYIKNQKYEVAVLPVGATEPHGYHLPYGTDIFWGEKLADQICEAAFQRGAKVILLPTIPYGVDSNLLQFQLTVNVHQSTLDAVIVDVIHSLESHEINKLVIFNGHGGNNFKPLLHSLYGRTKIFVCVLDWWKIDPNSQHMIFDEIGDHAGELETSMALMLFEDLVHFEEAGNGYAKESRFGAINQKWVSITRPWHILTEDTGVGDPRKATKEKGKAFLNIVIEQASHFLTELSNSKVDDAFPY